MRALPIVECSSCKKPKDGWWAKVWFKWFCFASLRRGSGDKRACVFHRNPAQSPAKGQAYSGRLVWSCRGFFALGSAVTGAKCRSRTA